MPRILIAEDDAILIKMYKYNFEQEGFEVEMAANGAEAIDAIEKKKPDCMLLDLLMPKVDGFAVMEHIKKSKYEFPVIVLSNLSQQIDQQKSKEMGAADVFVKSDMDLPKLITKMKEIVT